MHNCIRGSSQWVMAPNAKLHVLSLSVLPKIRTSEMFNSKVNTIQPCIYFIFWFHGTASYLYYKWKSHFSPFTLICISWPFKDQLNKDTYICICTLYAIVLLPSCLDHGIALGKRPFRKKLQRCLAWWGSSLEHPAPAMQHTLMHHINSSITKQTFSTPERRQRHRNNPLTASHSPSDKEVRQKPPGTFYLKLRECDMGTCAGMCAQSNGV